MRPCCASTLKSDIEFESYESWWNGSLLTQLRQELFSGKQPVSCSRCWEDEAVGRPSLRQNYNSMLSKFVNFDKLKQSSKNNFIVDQLPSTWELHIGNICNLKCVMCNPGLSHQIANEQKTHADTIKSMFPIVFESKNRSLTKQSLLNWSETDLAETFLKKINVDLKWLKLQGGEPLAVKNILNLISNLSSQTILALTTNGTVLTESMLEEFNNIKKLEISISLESVGSENDIIRYGSKWEVIHHNIQQLKKLSNVELQINHVLQVTSVFYLPDVIKFCEDNELHLNIINLTYPDYLSLLYARLNILLPWMTKLRH
jgi:sulfatase maturation enzyme AslB (radical SAM superfamily)